MDAFIDNITLGMVRHLEKLDFVHSVTVVEKEPADKVSLASWEQRNGCLLPLDMKMFYAATDGIHIQWTMKVAGEASLTGAIEINSLKKLIRVTPKRQGLHSQLPTVLDIETDDSEDENAPETTENQKPRKPRFSERCRAFLLDPCQGNGKVCIVFPPSTSGAGSAEKCQSSNTASVWFQDRALEWYYMAPDFSSYLRLAVLHLGITHWQCALTPWGPLLKTKQLLKICAASRLSLDENGQENSTNSHRPTTNDFLSMLKTR